MTRIIPPILIGAATGLTDVGARVIENQPVGATTAVTIACFVGTACLWLSKKFEDRDKALADHNLKIAEALSDYNLKLSNRLTVIEQRIADFPCPGKGPGGCDR